MPLLVSCITEQVMVVHDCLRKCSSARCAANRALNLPCSCNVCRVVAACNCEVPDSNCTKPACVAEKAGWQLRDVHHRKNTVYVVVDSALGFVPEATLRLHSTSVDPAHADAE